MAGTLGGVGMEVVLGGTHAVHMAEIPVLLMLVAISKYVKAEVSLPALPGRVCHTPVTSDPLPPLLTPKDSPECPGRAYGMEVKGKGEGL